MNKVFQPVFTQIRRPGVHIVMKYGTGACMMFHEIPLKYAYRSYVRYDRQLSLLGW